MYVIIGLLMFLLLILIHELGHFTAAKLSGIKVNEFSVGMGPNIKNWKKGETKYSLRALPIGGYVAMEGEEEDSEDERSYNNAKPIKRFITILAGPMMNLLLAFIIFTGIFMVTGIMSNTVGEVMDASAAQSAGLKKGDEIVSIDGKKMTDFDSVSKAIKASEGRSMDIKFVRDGQEMSVKVAADKTDAGYLLGVSPMAKKDFARSITAGFDQVINIIVLLWTTLVQLVTGGLGLENLSGPVGVIKEVGTAASYGVATLFSFIAIISVNLGFFNLLPIPALDGSKLLFITLEMIFGRPINRKFEQTVTIVGFLLLLSLIVVVSVKDVYSIIK